MYAQHTKRRRRRPRRKKKNCGAFVCPLCRPPGKTEPSASLFWAQGKITKDILLGRRSETTHTQTTGNYDRVRTRRSESAEIPPARPHPARTNGHRGAVSTSRKNHPRRALGHSLVQDTEQGRNTGKNKKKAGNTHRTTTRKPKREIKRSAEVMNAAYFLKMHHESREQRVGFGGTRASLVPACLRPYGRPVT